MGAALASLSVWADQKSQTLDIYWVDSEGGGSTLIVTPANESVLIDTGNPGGRDSGRILQAAKLAGLVKIDHMVITHSHTDHFGGAAEIAQRLPVGTVHHRAIPDRDPDGRVPSTFPVQIKPFREISAPRATLQAGTAIPLKSSGAKKLALVCLAADQILAPTTKAPTRTLNPLTGTVPPKAVDLSDNANSAVFILEFGDFRFFDGGDLTWNIEEKLVTPYNLPGTVDVYQTNHHGLDVSNHPVLLQSLAPTVVVMNNGPKKGGQSGAFNAIRKVPTVTALYQMHRSMNVEADENAPAAYLANHGTLTGAAAAECSANLIKLTVAADSLSYRISIPATGATQSFQTKRR